MADANDVIWEYELCATFGWTLDELAAAPLDKVRQFILIHSLKHHA